MSAVVNTTLLLALAAACAPQVDAATANAIVTVESGRNPHAIGVVGGTLMRQPLNRAEALATAKALHLGGWNFSVGLAQINSSNFSRLGMSIENALEPCTNLGAMQTILGECYERAVAAHGRGNEGQQHALRNALSCYYSGNFTTGFRHGYVARVVATARSPHPVRPLEAQ